MRSYADRSTLLLLAAAILACGDAGARSINAAPGEVVIEAMDFAFRAPDTIPSGPTRLRLINDGNGLHHATLVRLADGHSAGELLSADLRRTFPSWATPVGGPNVPEPGEASEVVVDLAPGNYAVICLVSSPGEHASHLTKGMLRALVVTRAVGAKAAEPVADARIVLDDYTFTVTPLIRPGRRTIRVETVSAQPHELTVIRLEPGKTVEDALGWSIHREGPPPMRLVGGVTPVARGVVNYFVADFVPGTYALLCFVPNRVDGKRHVTLGMIRTLEIGEDK